MSSILSLSMKIIQATFGVFHHFELAAELYRRGHLERIYSTFPWRRLKREGLPRAVVETFPWIHTTQFLLGRKHLLTPAISEMFSYHNATTFDRWSCNRIPSCDALITLDNLALADKLMGHIRSKLKQADQWDGSTIVVMGDHSWRTESMWSGSSQWTKEEQIASDGGEFDDRPVYVVKLPDQQTGTRIDLAFDALQTRKLFDALLEQRIRNADDFSAWMKQTSK